MKYRCLLIDSPWPEQGGGKSCRGAQRHFPLMTHKEILGLPIADVAADDAHCWLCVTDRFLPEGLACLKAYGFRYVRSWIWGKSKQELADELVDEMSDDQLDGVMQIGLGQYGRNCHEQILFGVRGNAMVPPPDRRPRSLFHARRGEHSRKPERLYSIVETVSDGPRLEVFARNERPGWTTLGNELNGRDIVDELKMVAEWN